jgi:RimJ/RimL family protein N-acetyltransferase
MVDAPVLETARLVLRAPVLADWEEYLAMMRSERVLYMGGPFDISGAWGMFCSEIAQWPLFGCGALTLEVRETGRCAGLVSINPGLLFPEWELGWMVYPEVEGQGLAFEGAQAMRDWAFRVRGLPTLLSYMDAENTRSRRLAERLGTRFDPQAPRPDPEDVVYRHPSG